MTDTSNRSSLYDVVDSFIDTFCDIWTDIDPYKSDSENEESEEVMAENIIKKVGISCRSVKNKWWVSLKFVYMKANLMYIYLNIYICWVLHVKFPFEKDPTIHLKDPTIHLRTQHLRNKSQLDQTIQLF